MNGEFEALIEDALAQDTGGWDFSYAKVFSHPLFAFIFLVKLYFEENR